MARFPSVSRRVSVGVFAVLTAFGSLTQPSTASANCGVCGAVHNIAVMQVAVGAAALGGMVIGAAAASASHGSPYYGSSYYGGYCTILRRQAVDEFGNVYVRRIRVCQ